MIAAAFTTEQLVCIASSGLFGFGAGVLLVIAASKIEEGQFGELLSGG